MRVFANTFVDCQSVFRNRCIIVNFSQNFILESVWLINKGILNVHCRVSSVTGNG
jgi:hypothetical protein